MPPFTDDFCFLPAGELARRIRAGEVSPTESLAALVERIGRIDPLLNTYACLDLEGALVDAKHKEQLLANAGAETDLGPLFGVPVAVKDDLPVKGMPCKAGSRLCSDLVAEYDDLTVQRLRAAGAIILGKTHLPEFGHKGTTDNRLSPDGSRKVTVSPWGGRDRTAGGSSGGSASAVAAGLAHLALGTDIGGSIRIPASCCGVVGLKPTFGTIPRVPSGNAFSLWVSGPIARTVADVALAMRVLAGPHPGDRFSIPLADNDAFDLKRPLPRRLRVGWPVSVTGEPVDAAVE